MVKSYYRAVRYILQWMKRVCLILRILALCRYLLIVCYVLGLSVLGVLLSVFRPFHANNVYIMSQMFSRVSFLMGIEVEVRARQCSAQSRGAIYVANHQNVGDIFLFAAIVQPRTVVVAKRVLLFIPVFGLMFWSVGNILIYGTKNKQPQQIVQRVVKSIKQRNLSIWVFPEGVHNQSKVLLPFKTGAFHIASQANLPIIPLCMSSSTHLFRANRWNNGKVIIEMLEPQIVNGKDHQQVTQVSRNIREMMGAKVMALDEELINTNPIGHF